MLKFTKMDPNDLFSQGNSLSGEFLIFNRYLHKIDDYVISNFFLAIFVFVVFYFCIWYFVLYV